MVIGIVQHFVALMALLLSIPPCLAQTIVFNETAPQFGAVALGQSITKTLSMLNASGTPIFIHSITAAQDFAQTNNCHIWLAEGSVCLIFITFTPHAAGERTGKLAVAAVGVGEQVISLSGVGFAQLSGHGGAVPPQIPAPIRTTNNEERVQQSLNNKKSYTFEDLLNKNPKGVADAKEIFALTGETVMKQRMASILLSIGVKDQVYFEYLTNEAKKALAHDHDIPWPTLYDGQGFKKALNPELNEWCETHGLGFWDMDDVEYYQIPVAWYYLAAAGDPRTYNLLIKGLHSQNLMIAAMAAKGLAKLQDARAIGKLIAAGRQVPGEARAGIAEALMYFADPKAQTAAEELMPEKNLIEVVRSEVKKNGTRNLFAW